jgi:hypothetical protein
MAKTRTPVAINASSRELAKNAEAEDIDSVLPGFVDPSLVNTDPTGTTNTTLTSILLFQAIGLFGFFVVALGGYAVTPHTDDSFNSLMKWSAIVLVCVVGFGPARDMAAMAFSKLARHFKH